MILKPGILIKYDNSWESSSGYHAQHIIKDKTFKLILILSIEAIEYEEITEIEYSHASRFQWKNLGTIISLDLSKPIPHAFYQIKYLSGNNIITTNFHVTRVLSSFKEIV